MAFYILDIVVKIHLVKNVIKLILHKIRNNDNIKNISVNNIL